MSYGTAIIIVGIFYLITISEGFRLFFFVFLSLAAGTILYLIDFGSDKPQTIFYNSSAHPAFLLHVGDVCPSDRHVWNGWCVK